MLLQTNSYIVPREKRMEHARVLRRFRQTLMRLGCDHFEVYEQTGANWSSGDASGRFVQIMRFRDRRHQLAVQAAERQDPAAQAVIREFCDLINYPYQHQQGLFAVGYYTSFLRTPAPLQSGPTGSESNGDYGTGSNGEGNGESNGHAEEAPPTMGRIAPEADLAAEEIVQPPDIEIPPPNGSPQPLQPEETEILGDIGAGPHSLDSEAEEHH